MKTESSPSPAKTPKRVLIVDDHPFMRLGISEAIRHEEGFVVCGCAASAEEALLVTDSLKPDLILTDLKLPGKSGLELIKDISVSHPKVPVIVLSMHEDEIYAERCLRAGSRGYVMKNEGPERLMEAIHTVLAGGVHISAKVSERIVEAFSGRRSSMQETALGQLSDREFEVFQWLGRGLATKEIADRLHLSAKTVETHRMHIKSKLGLATAAELIAYAARWAASEG